MAVRRHRSARVEIGVDHRAERTRTFEPRVEVEAQLARHGKIGTLACRDDNAIGRGKRERTRRSAPCDDEAITLLLYAFRAETENEFQPSAVDELLQIAAELAARGNLIGRSTSEYARNSFAAHSPIKCVRGSVAARRARSSNAFAAECPPPITSTRWPL